jgi:predicted DNA binding CopG/RHH family protein
MGVPVACARAYTECYGGGEARDMADGERRLFGREYVSMAKELTPAKLPLPKFNSDEEAAEYFETHAKDEIWDKLPGVPAPKLSKKLAKTIQERRAAAKAPISIRLDSEQIAAAKKIAAAKSVGYQTQLRMWIAEGIRRERRRAS